MNEECDDGNLRDDDGCSATCSREECADGTSTLAAGGPAETRDLSLDGPGQRGIWSDLESIVLADLDDDGDQDIAGVSGGSLGVLLNEGNDRFSQGYSFLSLDRGESVTAFDVDGDDDFDLLVVDEQGEDSLLLFRNDGAANFPDAPGPIPLYPDGPEAVVAADLDQDGATDLVVAFNGVDGAIHTTGPGGLAVCFGDGEVFEVQELSAGFDPESVALSDLDGDDLVDIAAANEGSGTVSILLNAGHRAFDDPYEIEVGRDPESIAAGDVDGDTHPDLVVANGFVDEVKGVVLDNTVSVLLNDGTGRFAPPVEYAVGIDPFFVLLADLDGDLDLDIATANKGDVWADTGRSISLLENLDHGVIADAVELSGGGVEIARPNALTAGDVDGDCMADLIVGKRFGAATLFATRNQDAQ